MLEFLKELIEFLGDFILTALIMLFPFAMYFVVLIIF